MKVGKDLTNCRCIVIDSSLEQQAKKIEEAIKLNVKYIEQLVKDIKWRKT